MPRPSLTPTRQRSHSRRTGERTALVVKTINSAQTTIRLAAYSFTSKPIALALLEAKKRGVDVEAVVDKSNATARYTAATFLSNQGVPVRVDYAHKITHDKYIVVDNQTVETGSFNFTSSAENSNAENAIALHDPQIAAIYTQDWQRLWAESEAMPPKY